MSRFSIGMVGLALLALGGAASAKDKLEPRTQALLSCGAITDNAARLNCFDRSIAAIRSAVEQGELVVQERPKPRALEGVVVKTGSMGTNRYWVELDNGDRWELKPASARDEAPRVGIRVKLRKRIMGDYWFSGPRWPDSEAEFLGREAG